jgi:hypothetical protein
VNRRAFLKWMLAAPAIIATVDVEQLLWTPKPMVTVPAMPTGLSFHRDAFTFVMTDMALADYQRQYNYARSKAVELIALAPKPPFIAWPPSGPYVAMRDPDGGVRLQLIAGQVTRYDILVGFAR